ncbi:MAG: hypothetical protein ACRDY7_16720 [Acidimicrobiia bacterium]
MLWLVLKIVIAVAAGLAFYLFMAGVIRSFAKGVPDAEPDPIVLRPVNYRYRCTVGGPVVTMTSAPDGDVPDSPRPGREDMSLGVEGGRW